MSTANLVRGAEPAGTGIQPPRMRRVSERRDEDARSQLVRRVLAEFREMPCLRLTPPQAQRLFGLREDVAARIIESLIGQGHLRLDADGRYAATESG